jgi:hypothetical protein
MTSKTVAMVVFELAIGVVLGFTAWTFVTPFMVAANPPSA